MSLCMSYQQCILTTTKLFCFVFPVSSYRGEKLRLKRVQRHQMGAYLCIASNSVPPSVSKRIRLNVNCEYREKCSDNGSDRKMYPSSYFIAVNAKGFLIETNSQEKRGGMAAPVDDLRDIFCIQKETEKNTLGPHTFQDF